MSGVAYELLMGLVGLLAGIALIWLWAIFFQFPRSKGPALKLPSNDPRIFDTLNEALARLWKDSL